MPVVDDKAAGVVLGLPVLGEVSELLEVVLVLDVVDIVVVDVSDVVGPK